MGLRIKSVDEIFSSLITWITTGTQKLTDFSVGSAVRTLTESFSLQLEEFYFDLHMSVLYAIENSVYEAFGFAKYQATKATGEVTISFRNNLTSQLIVTKGTKFYTSTTTNKRVVYFTVIEDTIVPEGSSQTQIKVECSESGVTGNVGAYTVVNVSPFNPNYDTIFNDKDFVNGREEESAAQRKLRFKQYIRSLQRGTREAIEYGAKTVAGVAGVYVDDQYIGFVRVYIHDINGNLSEELKNSVLTELINWRAAGIEVEVLPIVNRKVDLSLTIIFKDDTDIPTYVNNLTTLTRNFLNSFQVADNLYMSNLISTIMESYRDVVVDIQIDKGSDIYLQSNELIRAGDIEVTGVRLSDWRT